MTQQPPWPPGGPAYAWSPPPRRRSLAWLWILLAVLAAGAVLVVALVVVVVVVAMPSDEEREAEDVVDRVMRADDFTTVRDDFARGPEVMLVAGCQPDQIGQISTASRYRITESEESDGAVEVTVEIQGTDLEMEFEVAGGKIRAIECS